MDINLINGNEIIDFLNKITKENREDLCDISIEGGSFVFENQVIKNGQNSEYILTFTGSYNNCGESQDINGNGIRINNVSPQKQTDLFTDEKDSIKVRLCLCEPFDSDGTDDVLEEVLTEWLKTHTFSKNLEEDFDRILQNVYDDLPTIGYSQKEELQQIINQLVKAKTLMK